MTISTNRESDRFMLRLPDGMRDRIAETAKANGRSMNAEIIHRLETTFEMDLYTPSENAQPDNAVRVTEQIIERVLRRVLRDGVHDDSTPD